MMDGTEEVEILDYLCKVKCGRAYGTLLLAGCLLAGSMKASAQEQVWNAALDRYEYICRRCADWRARIQLGQSVPRDSLQVMTRELSEVKKNLQYALGEMTPGQRRRFEAIRDWFTSGEWPLATPAPILPEGYPFDSGLRPSLEMTEGGLASLSVRPAQSSFSGQSSPSSQSHTPPRALAGVTIGVYPDLSYGLFAGITVGKWGLFVKGRSNFHWQKTGYDCLSDGTIPSDDTPGNPTAGSNSSGTPGSNSGSISGSEPEGGYFWSGNAKTVNRHQITLDVSYALWKPISVYIGAGYGLRTLCWKDSEGEWARVRDRSYRNVALDAGLLIHPISRGPAQGLTFLLGGSWIPKTYLDAEAGLAWRF